MRKPGWANTVIGDLLSEMTRLDERIAQYDRHIARIAKDSTPARQLMQLPGVGPATATALVAMIGRAQEFKCGRQLSAWLGLVPGQYSSGGKQRLGRITSRLGRGQGQERCDQPLGRTVGRSRGLRLRPPARVFHQGPQH